MSKELQGVIFDFNGVMIDDYVLQKEAWSEIAQEIRGSAVTDKELVDQIRGIPTRVTVERMTAEAGKTLTEAELHDFDRRKDAIVQDLFAKSPLSQLTKGLSDFLAALKRRNIPSTIASSSSIESLKIIFDRFNLYQWFDITTIIHKDSTLHGKKMYNKPAPDPYLAAAQIINLPPANCVVFEDAKSGIISAKAAGVETIIAINSNPDNLRTLLTLPGVTGGSRDFTEITVESLFG